MAVDIETFPDKNEQFNRGESKISKSLLKSTITEVREKKKGYVNPVIVTFQNGDPNEKFSSNFKAILSPKENGGTTLEVKTTYGHVFKDCGINENFKNTTLLAIRNQKTNKIKLVEVDHAILINSALLSSEIQTSETSNYMKDIKTLNKSFGGKRAKYQYDIREKLNISSSFVAKELEETISNIEVGEKSSLSMNNTDTDSIIDVLPPHNREANILSEVYKFKNFLSEDELNSLSSVKLDDVDTKEFSPFFQYCLKKIESSGKDYTERTAEILFIETLIKFIKIPASKLTVRNVSSCSSSSLIGVKLLNEFCIKTNNSVTRPMKMKDKCMSYILATSLICCNYEIDLKLLSTASGVNFTTLSRLARIVGAVPKTKDQQIFVLKLPLQPLPKITTGKKQKR